MKSCILILLVTSWTSPGNRVPSSTSAACITQEEKTLLSLIMTYRKEKRLTEIPFSSKLTQVAQTHVRDLAANFDYDNKSNCNPHSWSDKGVWSPCCYTPDHRLSQCMWNKPKEIAGYPGNGFEIAFYHSAKASAFEALGGWKSSEGHNAVLTNIGIWKDVEWKAIGVGIYERYAVVWFGEVSDESSLTICGESK